MISLQARSTSSLLPEARGGSYIALQQGILGPLGKKVLRHERRVPMIVSYLLRKIREYLQYRRTVRELSNLSDRDLSDVGIARFEIDTVARQTCGL